MAEDNQAEEIAKYKRVLSLARSSLEANQATIAAKDQQIAQLIKALEDEKSSNKSKRVLGKDEEAALVPRKILCRVDVEDTIWILVEYEEFDDTWKSMESEQDLEDFIQRVPGVPLTCPTRCLSQEESNRIMDESKKRVDRIVEEFRRYKVRTEIAKKQKDAETRQAVVNGTNSMSAASQPSNGAASNGLSGPLERALTMGSMDQPSSNGTDEVSRLRATLAEQETKWRQSYEIIARENDILRSKGGESLLATQWRGRYEACMKERDELSERLASYSVWTNSVTSSGKSVDQAYVELQEEFRTFRKKLAAIDRRKQRTTASAALSGAADGGASGSAGAGYSPAVESELSALLREYELNANGSATTPTNGRANRHRAAAPEENDDASAGMTAAKIKYVRHMIVQYLGCKEAEVKTHIETALMTIFRMSPEEREVIESKRKEDATDALSSITSFLGSLGT